MKVKRQEWKMGCQMWSESEGGGLKLASGGWEVGDGK